MWPSSVGAHGPSYSKTAPPQPRFDGRTFGGRTAPQRWSEGLQEGERRRAGTAWGAAGARARWAEGGDGSRIEGRHIGRMRNRWAGGREGARERRRRSRAPQGGRRGGGAWWPVGRMGQHGVDSGEEAGWARWRGTGTSPVDEGRWGRHGVVRTGDSPVGGWYGLRHRRTARVGVGAGCGQGVVRGAAARGTAPAYITYINIYIYIYIYSIGRLAGRSGRAAGGQLAGPRQLAGGGRVGPGGETAEGGRVGQLAGGGRAGRGPRFDRRWRTEAVGGGPPGPARRGRRLGGAMRRRRRPVTWVDWAGRGGPILPTRTDQPIVKPFPQNHVSTTPRLHAGFGPRRGRTLYGKAKAVVRRPTPAAPTQLPCLAGCLPVPGGSRVRAAGLPSGTGAVSHRGAGPIERPATCQPAPCPRSCPRLPEADGVPCCACGPACVTPEADGDPRPVRWHRRLVRRRA